MALDELPVISREVHEAHSARLRNPQEYYKFIREAQDYLRNNNLPLFAIIEIVANDCNDPHAVRNAAYTALTLVNDQLATNRLEKENFH